MADIEEMTTEQSLAALLEVAPPELAEVLTRWCIEAPGGHQPLDGTVATPCRVCGEPLNRPAGRVTLPVPEATLAAMQWWLSKTGRFVRYTRAEHDLMVIAGSYEERGYGTATDIFSAIRAAMGGE